MIKKTLLILIVFLLQSEVVSAHTGITSSTPADGEVIVEEIHEVVLEFNTEIESTSTVNVSDENGEEIAISNLEIIDHIMTAAFMSPLDNGTYIVEWKIIGADGHPIQGSYSFTVSQDNAGDSNINEKSPSETPVIPNEKTADRPVEQSIEDTSKIASNDVLVIILVVLFTIAGGFFGWMIGRRQK